MENQSGHNLWSIPRPTRRRSSSSHQSVGLDEEEEDVVVENVRATVPKDNRQVMGNKWEKARAPMTLRLQKCPPHGRNYFRLGRTRKMRGTSSCWMRKRREWIGTGRGWRRSWKLREREDRVEKKEATIKWELEKAKTFGEIELEKETLQIARGMEDVKIMLADESLLDEHARKRLVGMKKEINKRREYETARAAMATVEHAARMQAEDAARMLEEREARMDAEQEVWMVSIE